MKIGQNLNFKRFIQSGLLLAIVTSAHSELIISEFLAVNSGITLTDEDNFPADWIEIHNPDASPVALDGYYLTDDPAVPNKWAFPALTLPSEGYLRVFASGKNRTADPAFLHTNFSLNAQGEYLALIKPDGFTIADEFSPAYPPQFKDISYGLGNESPILEETILPLGAPLTYLVPNADIGDTWKSPGFDDSTWTQSASAVGFNYDDKPSVGSAISPTGDVEDVMFQKNASIYLRFPFQVVDVNGVSELRLKVKNDDGFVAFINGTEVASKNPPVGALTFNSSASGSDEVEEGEEFEVYSLPLNTLVTGPNLLAVHGLNSAAGNNDFIFISELEGNIQDLTAPQIRGFFPTPSPGEDNGPPLLNPASEVLLDSTSRAFVNSFQLTLSVAEPEATIRYTTNGDAVDETATEYTGPIPITGSTQIRTRAFLPGALPGPSRTEGFVKLATSEADFSSDLPVIILSTFGEGVPPPTDTTIRDDVFMLIYEPDPLTGRTTLDSTPVITTRAGFRKRGRSSANFAKYAMSVETWDENNDDRNISPFGFASEADWILNSRFSFDLSLMRNAFIYDLSNQIGRWAVKTQFVELYNDTSGTEVTSTDYFGVYTFMERIDSDNGRLDIADLDPWENSPEEITGGYIFKKDQANPGDTTFSVAGLGSTVYVEPDQDEISPTQNNYLSTYTNEILPALTAANGINPSTGLHYSDYLDVDSFLDNFWLNILAMDPDWGRLSQFFYKDRGEKLNAGPIWDFDRTMGSRDPRDNDPRRWAGTGDTSLPFYDSRYPFFGRLYGFEPIHASPTLVDPQLKTSRPDLFQELIDRWFDLRSTGFSTDNMNSTISSLAFELNEAQERNFSRWALDITPGIESLTNFADTGLEDWDREVSHLQGWLEARTSWIDEQFLARPALAQNGGVVDPGFELVMSSADGQIYFTTDGSDPRAPGGEPSTVSIPFDGGPVDDVLIPEIEAAASYFVPFDDSLGLTWTEAGFDDASWAIGSSGIGFETAGGALEPGVTTNISTEMESQNASCYMRFEFDFNNAQNINSLVLGMKYDDGFIAYLNGVEVARDHAPEVSTWNSSATDARSDSEAIGSFVQFDISEHANAVLNGRNVLAIHGMNRSAGSNDFLCLPTIAVNHVVAATPVVLNETTFITARTYDGLEWSAPTTASFVIGSVLASDENLVISEIMYDPATPTTAEELAGFTADRFFEYLEILNTGTETVDLTEVTFIDGIDFSFAGSAITSLSPGARALVVRSIAGFTERYGNGPAAFIAGEFANGTGLSGNGERLIMTGAEGVIADITYNNNPPWATSPAGNGPSLVYLSGANNPALAGNWRPSVETLGNPGTGDAILFSGDPTEDKDGDGINAFAEYAYGTDDTIPNAVPLTGQFDPDGHYSFTFPRNLAADDALIVLQISTDLETWNEASFVLGPATEIHLGNGNLTYTYRTPTPAVANSSLFARLQVFQR